jgi:hypothetical protein
MRYHTEQAHTVTNAHDHTWRSYDRRGHALAHQASVFRDECA